MGYWIGAQLKKGVTQGTAPNSGMGRPERGHKGGEGERGMKDTGKDTPSCRQVTVLILPR